MSSQMAFFIDSSVCVGCKTCEIACKDQNDLSVGPRPRYVREFHGGTWVADEQDPTVKRQEGVFSYNVSMGCNHCANPACVPACPQGAMQKDPDTGIVWSDPEKCIGCGMCALACPYGAPQVEQGADSIRKCNFCKDLLAEGKAPACVETCPMRALDFGDYNDLVAKYGDVRDVAPLPSSSETQPSIVIKPHRDAKYDLADGYSVTLYPEG
ncbi:4Fe-4S dicluster domain-containing protein [Eggerthella sinensis]|jgi:anaerobic dimethyl sulfoxide reductase subunit B|uniref:4Fe-4S dicluster domain-containing protein n=1 Tax=Eggerthella sinensis TaxID=242230 RepID=UPI00248D7EA8|nr:4Fe-4S dicluster domain-containing protein [Eggerthella sinensis]